LRRRFGAASLFGYAGCAGPAPGGFSSETASGIPCEGDIKQWVEGNNALAIRYRAESDGLALVSIVPQRHPGARARFCFFIPLAPGWSIGNTLRIAFFEMRNVFSGVFLALVAHEVPTSS
jgi:hypothetical protein